jgi:hypothetical protein
MAFRALADDSLPGPRLPVRGPPPAPLRPRLQDSPRTTASPQVRTTCPTPYHRSPVGRLPGGAGYARRSRQTRPRARTTKRTDRAARVSERSRAETTKRTHHHSARAPQSALCRTSFFPNSTEIRHFLNAI